MSDNEARLGVITTVIFDCFGVLYAGSLTQLMNACPTEQRAHELRDATKAADNGFINREQYLSDVMRATGLTRPQVIEIMRGAQVRSQEVFDYARSLKTRGYQIAVFSNIGAQTIHKLFNEDDFELFDAIIASGDLGVTKPHVTAYERVVTQLGVLPEQALMIDDMYGNITGAEDAGLSGVVFSSLPESRTRIEELLTRA